MVYIILPVHNEARTIVKTASELFSWCQKNLGNYKIIFVNDHSDDGTEDKLFCIEPIYKLGVVNNLGPRGKGAALKFGFDCIDAKDDDEAIFMDGDGQIRPKDIGPLLNLMKLYDADAVIGNKRHLYSLVDYGPVRSVVSRVFNFITNRFLGIPFADTQCGLKAFKTSALKAVIGRVKSNKFAFDAELVMALRINKYRVVESPITLGEQLNAGSVNIKNIIETLKDTGGIVGRLHKSFYKGGSPMKAL